MIETYPVEGASHVDTKRPKARMNENDTAVESANPIVFFDGVCNLCNAAVDWVVRHDTKHHFRFSSLQGEAAEKFIPATDRSELKSIVVYLGGKTLRESDAILFIMRGLPGIWPWVARVAAIVPKPLRNSVYGLVAKTRYMVFGKRKTCRVPSREERALFLP